jgi:hypothetical protein
MSRHEGDFESDLHERCTQSVLDEESRLALAPRALPTFD